MTTKAWEVEGAGAGAGNAEVHPWCHHPPNWRYQDHLGRKGECGFTLSAFCAGGGLKDSKLQSADAGDMPGRCE